MLESITTNNKVDRYQTVYAQVNLAIAQGVAQKETITDEERATISQLVQAAISWAKASIANNPGRSGNWLILARVYQSIMGFAQGADVFAVQTLTQAGALDPLNPNLRIALGGIYYSIGNYDEAIKAFELATLAKPDLPNAHYNLAQAYRQKGENDKAQEALSKVLSLIDKETPDFSLVEAELEDIKAKKSLPSPTPTAQPIISPPLELPEEASPPQTPSPTTPLP